MWLASTLLEMILYYTENRPDSYYPSGFVDNNTDELVFFPENTAWSPCGATLNNIETPFHR